MIPEILVSVRLDISQIQDNKALLEREPPSKLGQVYRFTDADDCVDFITDFQNVFIIFEIFADNPLSLDNIIVSTLASVITMQSIILRHVEHGKIVSIVWRSDRIMDNDLVAKLDSIKQGHFENDQEQLIYNIWKISSIAEEKNQQDPEFMYIRLLRDIFCEMDSPLEMMIEFLHEKFLGNPDELKLIDEINRNYSNYSPIYWYTRDGLLYKTLNQALRNMDIETIVNLRRFIKDIHEQLLELNENSTEQKQWQTLYRGVLLPKSKLIEFQNSQGCLFCVNQFFSTTLEKDIAIVYAGESNDADDLISMVFEITIPSHLSHVVLSDIQHLSNYGRGEQEVLFTIGSIFRIDSIDLLTSYERVYCVQLTFTNEEDEQLLRLTSYFRSEWADLKGYDKLIQLLLYMDEYQLAKDITRLYIKTSPGDTTESVLYLASCVYSAGYRNEATEISIQALDFERQSLSYDDPKLVRVYKVLAFVYFSGQHWDKALEHYLAYIKLEKKPRSLATAYSSIGQIYQKKNDFLVALQYYNRAITLRLECLPSNHPEMATSRLHLANMLIKFDYHSKALDLLAECLKIQQHSLPKYHRALTDTHSTISVALIKEGKLKDGIEHLDKALLISEKVFGRDHPSTISCRTLLDKLRQKLRNN